MQIGISAFFISGLNVNVKRVATRFTNGAIQCVPFRWCLLHQALKDTSLLYLIKIIVQQFHKSRLAVLIFETETAVFKEEPYFLYVRIIVRQKNIIYVMVIHVYRNHCFKCLIIGITDINNTIFCIFNHRIIFSLTFKREQVGTKAGHFFNKGRRVHQI